MESVAVETIEGKQVRDKKLADTFVNEYLRTGRISDKAFNYYNTATATEGGNLVPQDLYEKIIRRAEPDHDTRNKDNRSCFFNKRLAAVIGLS